MTARATESEVKELMQTALTTDQIAPFLRMANVYISSTLSGEGYGDDLLKEIEKCLAAHFVAIRDPMIKSESYGDGSITFHGESGKGLEATPWGQQVMLLEHHGVLAQIAQSKGPMEVKAII